MWQSTCQRPLPDDRRQTATSDVCAQVVPLRGPGVRHVLRHRQGRELGIHEVQLIPVGDDTSPSGAQFECSAISVTDHETARQT